MKGRNIASQHFRGRVGEAANRNTSAQAPRGPREGRHEHDCHALRGWPSRRYLSDERDLPHGILSSSCRETLECPGKWKYGCSSCSPCPHGKRKALCGLCTLLNALLMQLVRLVSQAQLPWLQVLCRRGKLCQAIGRGTDIREAEETYAKPWCEAWQSKSKENQAKRVDEAKWRTNKGKL